MIDYVGNKCRALCLRNGSGTPSPSDPRSLIWRLAWTTLVREMREEAQKPPEETARERAAEEKRRDSMSLGW